MVKKSGTRLRRTWPQRVLITANVLALLAAATAAGVLAYSNDRVAALKRNVFAEGVLAHDELEPGDAQNFLFVGVDDGAGAAGSAAIREAGSENTDTIMILRVDPEAGTAALLSFPRDLLVDVPGRESRARINSVVQLGGPQLLVETIRDNFAIPVHHYLQVNFAGFQELVRIVDGIPVWFPHPTRSRESVALEVPEAGCWVLGPEQALGFARARKDYQAQDADGRWHTDMGGDYSRVRRQQLFIELAMRQAIAKGARNLNTLRRLVDLGIGSVSTDDNLQVDAALDLARRFRNFDPGELQTYSLPVDEAPSGGPAYLYLREAEAEPILERFRDSDPGMAGDLPPVPVEDIVVQVRNGTGTTNQARDVTADLSAAGFRTLVPAADVGIGFPTVVQYAPGAEAQARVVASYLAGGFVFHEEDLAAGVDVVLSTGQGWAGVLDVPRAYGEVEVPAPVDTTSPDTASSETTSPDTTLGPEWDTGPDPGPTTTTSPNDGGLAPDGGDVEDPDDPAFYRASAPPPGATCQRTS